MQGLEWLCHLWFPEERDEYDEAFERLREASLKKRSVEAKEELADAVQMVEECRQKLKLQRESVLHWKLRVDRQCVERLKAFQKPPVLVGYVLEMVMILIGKKPTSDRLERRDIYPSKDDFSGQFSSSSGSTKTGVKKGKMKPPFLERKVAENDFKDKLRGMAFPLASLQTEESEKIVRPVAGVFWAVAWFLL